MMKTLFRSALAAGLLAAAPASAQMADVRSVSEVQYDLQEAERKAIIAEAMMFTEAEAAAFWPVYDKFRAEARQDQDRIVGIIAELAQNFTNLDEGEGDKIVSKALKARHKNEKTLARHMRRVQKVLPGDKLVRYYQIERTLESARAFAISQQIPLAPTVLERAAMGIPQ